MRIFGSGPQPFQNFPFIKDRVKGWNLWWRGGDVASPSGWNALRQGGKPGGGKWFNYLPNHVARRYFPLPVLPFFTARWGRFGFYIGWKAFGVDSAAYKDFPGINAAEVFDGSVALTGFTARFTGRLE